MQFCQKKRKKSYKNIKQWVEIIPKNAFVSIFHFIYESIGRMNMNSYGSNIVNGNVN